jgi:hypothetical protein
VRKRSNWPARQDSRITSQYIPETGDIVIGVARGFTGAGEVLYRLTPEVLAGAIEDRKELAVIVNNLGLLVLAQLSGFNLAESLDDLPRALARWGHMEKEFDETQREKQMAEALAIAQRTMHKDHGKPSNPEDPESGPADGDCPCRGTADQTVCASAVGCGFCAAAEAQRVKESDEGQRQTGNRELDTGAGRGDAEDAGGAADLRGAGPGDALAPDELGTRGLCSPE